MDAIVKSSVPAASPPAKITLHAEERHYLQSVMLDAAWLFPGPLDPNALQASLQALLEQYPILAGRRRGQAVVLDNSGVPFSTRHRKGSAIGDRHGAKNMGPGNLADRRSFFVPVMTVRVTLFADGTSALGIAMPHDIVDGFSFYKLVQLWSILHNEGPTTTLPYQWDRSVVLKSEAAKKAEAEPPVGVASSIPAVLSGLAMQILAGCAQVGTASEPGTFPCCLLLCCLPLSCLLLRCLPLYCLLPR